jgi:uncharacterized repeat protein (TIGR02543 family)
MKRTIMIRIALFLQAIVCTQAQAGVVAEGKVFWTLTENGVLTVTAEGTMPDFWRGPGFDLYREKIREVVIGEGSTRVGYSTACGNLYPNIEKITMANTVTHIGDHALGNDGATVSVTLSENLEEIGDWGIECKVRELRIPRSVKKLAKRAFALSYSEPTMEKVHVEWDVPLAFEEGSNIDSLKDIFHTTYITPARTLYVPPGTEALYRAAPVWSEFTYILSEPSSTLFTVSFDVQGGGPAASSAEVEYGNVVDAPAAPVRTGFDFAGWYTDAACADAWDFVASRVVSDVTLYAKWEIRKYTVSFDAQGGSPVSPFYGMEYGSAVNAPAAPVRQGFNFAGWYADAACTDPWDFAASVIVGNTTLYAKWEIRKYKVAFDAQGGSRVSPRTGVEYGSAVNAPVAPVRTGFNFAGWHTDTACTDPWDFASFVVINNMTLYAKWEIRKYTVAFDVRDGSHAPSFAEVEYGSIVDAPAAPVRAGFHFAGWYGDTALVDEWDFTASAIVSDTTLYAGWEKAGTGIGSLRNGSQITLCRDRSGNRITVAGLNGTENFMMFDLTGKPLIARRVEDGARISIASLPEGLYIIRIGDETRKWLK